MSEEIRILKLMDGSTIVGRVYNDGDTVDIEHPIELVSELMPLGTRLGEQINLRPWVAIAQEHIFTIDRINIITMGYLQQAFVEGYEKIVEQIYFTEPEWGGPMALEDMEPEEDLQTLAELAEAMLKNKIH